MLGAPAAPALKAMKAVYVPTNTIWRPYNSEKGAQSSGPRANPNTKSDTPSVTTSWLTLNSAIICWMPPENADEQNETTSTEFATAIAMIHFFVLGKVIGFLGSLSIHSTT
jgi:hypothetical protein